jgi:hypothetical protein
MAVLILFTSQNTNITAQLQSSNEIKLFPYNFENQVLQFQLAITKPEVAISRITTEIAVTLISWGTLRTDC